MLLASRFPDLPASGRPQARAGRAPC